MAGTMRKALVILGLLAFMIPVVLGPPISGGTKKHVTEAETQPKTKISTPAPLKYVRYLKEVSRILESDPEFHEKLIHTSPEDLMSGKLAQDLETLDRQLRDKLDVAKRREVERLRELANEEYELANGIDRDHLKISRLEHLDHSNAHTFEINDLVMLMKQALADIKKINDERKVRYKEYAMQKEIEKRMEMEKMTPEERDKFMAAEKAKEERNKRRERAHHPGSKAHYLEIWEKQDQMDPASFNPRIFFKLHDLDGNDFWDEIEVKALFIRELDKIYPPGNQSEDENRERAEDMEIMNEHVFNEADTNEDGLISSTEFEAVAKRREFNIDYDWDPIGVHQQFTESELNEFQRQNRVEFEKLIAEGMLQGVPNNTEQPVPEEEPANDTKYQYKEILERPVTLNPNQIYKTEGQDNESENRDQPVELSPSQIYTLVKDEFHDAVKQFTSTT